MNKLLKEVLGDKLGKVEQLVDFLADAYHMPEDVKAIIKIKNPDPIHYMSEVIRACSGLYLFHKTGEILMPDEITPKWFGENRDKVLAYGVMLKFKFFKEKGAGVVPTELANFLSIAYSMPDEIRMTLIDQCDDVEERNTATFAGCLMVYIMFTHKLEAEAATVKALKLLTDEDTLNGFFARSLLKTYLE